MKNRQDIDKFSDLTNLLTNLELTDKASKDRIYNRLTFKMRSGTIQSNFMKRDEILKKKIYMENCNRKCYGCCYLDRWFFDYLFCTKYDGNYSGTFSGGKYANRPIR